LSTTSSLTQLSKATPIFVALMLCCCTLGAFGQDESFIHGPKAPATAEQRRATIRKNTRFLGWNFARQSRQDASQWLRQSSRPQPIGSSDHPTSLIRSKASSAAAGFGDPGFLWRSSLPTGNTPTAITSGDFNEDGKMDFAVCNGVDNTIYVFLGNGDGTFQIPEILYTLGQSPVWITSARLHTTGHLDLVVADADSNTVEVFPGNGDGTFQASTQFAVPQIPTFVLATDANNDGNQDVVVGLTIAQDLTQPQFEVLLGDGSGGFSGTLFSPPLYGDPDGPLPTTWIAAGDVNNDGYVDFVTTISGGEAITYLNQSATGFLVGAPFGPHNGAFDVPLVVELGDMNEDGCLDAIETDAYAMVDVALGTCDGNFSPATTATPFGDFDPAIKVVDVNGDGHLDVVGSAVWYPNNGGGGYGVSGGYLVSVAMGDGKGDIGWTNVYRGGTSAYSLIVDDFTGDGKPEIITAASVENELSYFLNDGTGYYGNPQGESVGYQGSPINAPNPTAPMKTADFNGDGYPDLYLVEFGTFGEVNEPDELTVVLNDGSGNFGLPVRSPVSMVSGTTIPVFVAGAFRTPAAPDVIFVDTVNPTVVAYFQGNGDGTFGTPVTLATLPGPQQVVAGDFNNDGKLDFVVMGIDSTGTNWEFDVFLGHGDGTFTKVPAQIFPMLGTDAAQQLFAIDLNHDGKLDLLIGLNTNDGWVAKGDDLIEVLGNGDGTFRTPTILFSHFGSVAVADVNGDGLPDLIQNRNPGTNISASYFSKAGVTVYLGTSDGKFKQQPSYNISGVTQPSFNPAIVGDFNGDGIPDLAVIYWPTVPKVYDYEPLLLILQGVGDGTFIETGHNFQLPALSWPVVGADFSGNGTTDLMDLVGFSSSFTTIPAAPGPTLDLTINSSPISGTSGTATVTLDLPPTSTQTVALSASDPAIQIQSTATFQSGQQTQQIPFALGAGYDATHVFELYAQLGSQTAVGYGATANPNLNEGTVTSELSSATQPAFMAISIEPGDSFVFSDEITSIGKYTDTYSAFACGGLPVGASCSFSPNSIHIPAGGSGKVTVTVVTTSSTPFGSEVVTVLASDGVLPTSAEFDLGIGTFSFALNPTIIPVGPTGSTVATLSSSSTNGLNEPITFACTGLPSQEGCTPSATLYTQGGSMTGSVNLGINHSQLAPTDYPFQITGTADLLSQTLNAILRVGDFTASLDKTTATISAGGSTTFNVTLTSVNHYTSSITVSCQPATTIVTCTPSPVPANLSDGASVNVQLTVTSVSAAQTSRVWLIPPWKLANLLGLMILLPIVTIWRRPKTAQPILALIALASLLSCGGGNASGGGGSGGGGGGSGGGSTPQTVSVSVVAQAANTTSDTNNQKTLSPITVTVQ
jgi:hypothetical protein